ncbi:MAG: SocA family protein [Bacteroidales bacterium]|jgi:uncharacterized phage-associated protein|nr:SocA family protein [Bacteroidales bacterium]
MEVDRLKAIVLYVLNNVPDKCLGKHELFKILYFASQKHLIRYGDAMIADFYAFQYGPVPSALCNYLRGDKNNNIMSAILIDDESRYILSPSEEPDMDYLSKVDVQCLDESIQENFRLNFHDLTKKSHDSAWNKAWANPTGRRGAKMDIIDIAIAAGADERTIACIQENLEIEAALR